MDGITAPLPTDQTLLSQPSDQSLLAVTVGRGIQNYTCSNGAYASDGALANLYDASCVYELTKRFADAATISTLLPEFAYSALDYPDKSRLPAIIHHSFVNTAAGLSPKFARTTSNAYVIAQKAGTLNSPQNATIDVPWLELNGTEGTLAKTVFRLETVNGQPPSSCTVEGAPLSVQYAAMYFFFG